MLLADILNLLAKDVSPLTYRTLAGCTSFTENDQILIVDTDIMGQSFCVIHARAIELETSKDIVVSVHFDVSAEENDIWSRAAAACYVTQTNINEWTPEEQTSVWHEQI